MKRDEMAAVIQMRESINDLVRSYDPGVDEAEKRQREAFENLRRAAGAYKEAKGWAK